MKTSSTDGIFPSNWNSSFCFVDSFCTFKAKFCTPGFGCFLKWFKKTVLANLFLIPFAIPMLIVVLLISQMVTQTHFYSMHLSITHYNSQSIPQSIYIHRNFNYYYEVHGQHVNWLLTKFFFSGNIHEGLGSQLSHLPHFIPESAFWIFCTMLGVHIAKLKI